jgi:DNA-binding response OmpR family regulator
VVPVATLLDALWADQAAGSARHTSHLVSRLRKTFGTRLQTRRPGYTL